MIPSKLHKSGTLLTLVVGLTSGCSQEPTTDNSLSRSEQPITATAARPKPTSTPISNAPRQLTVFLPGQDGKLHETKLKEPSDLAIKQLWEPESALTLLFRKAPQFFPANTRLTDSIRRNINYPDAGIDTVFEVRLSKDFLNSQHWRDNKKAKLAFDAITRTAASGINETVMPSYPVNIYVLVDEKPVIKLGKTKVENPAET
jgi:hypothetical protein